MFIAMDITTLGKNGFRLKGKTSVVQIENGAVSIGSDKPFKIDAPGEYEVGGISVIGINVASPASIYVLELDGIRSVVLDKVTEKLSETQIEEMGPIDIVIQSELKQDVVGQIDPWVIVTEKGAEGVTPESKYSTTSDKLPTELQTVVLERKG